MASKDPKLHKSGRRSTNKVKVRQSLVLAGRELFGQRGYENVTTLQIAEKAGVSSRTLFRYFPTKEDILLSWLDGYAERMCERLRHRPAKESLRESLRRALDPYCCQPKEDLQLSFFIHDLSGTSANLRAQILHRQSCWEEDLADILQERLKDEPDGALRAKLFASFVMHALVRSVIQSRFDPLGRSVDQLVDVTFAMLFQST